MTRKTAANTLAAYFGTTAEYIGGHYDAYQVRDHKGRDWKLMSDSSIRPESRRGTATAEREKLSELDNERIAMLDEEIEKLIKLERALLIEEKGYADQTW